MSNMSMSYAASGSMERINMASVRGRPRGRRPLRGQFPVVPIDMVRQLGIEQQVILQPAAPVAMRNKGILSKPLTMSRRTQCDTQNRHISTQTDDAVATKSPEVKYVPIPLPIPLFIPVPCAMYERPLPVPCPIPIPIPVPLALLLDEAKDSVGFMKAIMEAKEKVVELSNVAKTGSDAKKRPRESESGLLPAAGEVKKPRVDEDTVKVEQKPYVIVSPSTVQQVDSGPRLRYNYGTNAWQHFIKGKNQIQLKKGKSVVSPDLLKMSKSALNSNLATFVKEVCKPSGEAYAADSIFYLCLGIQYHLQENDCLYDIFDYYEFADFISALDPILGEFKTLINADGMLLCRLEEKHFWETLQMGSHSSQVLLFTILYLIALKTGKVVPEAHIALTVGDVKLLPSAVEITLPEDKIVRIEQTSDAQTCPLQLFKNYIGKRPSEGIDDSSPFYLLPQKLADTEKHKAWYEAEAAPTKMLEHFLKRIKMIKEIQEGCACNRGQAS